MKLSALLLVGLVCAASSAAFGVRVLQVITPVGGDTAMPSQACHLWEAFDNQPVWDGTKPVNATISGVEMHAYGDDRWGYIDLGPDFANIRIYQTWTRYRQWSAGEQRVWEGGFWTNTNPATNNIIPSPITETRVAFQTNSSVPLVGTQVWYQDKDLSADPVTPSGRYLVMHTMNYPGGPGSDPRGHEYAIIGTIVPEPATMSLLGLGVVGLLRRRK